MGDKDIQDAYEADDSSLIASRASVMGTLTFF